MPIGPARMPLFDHLGELRRRLTIVVVSVIIGAVVMYFATPTVLDILKDPIDTYLPDRPHAEAGGLEEATLAVHEADPIIADTPDFVAWAAEQPGFQGQAHAFADEHGLDW